MTQQPSARPAALKMVVKVADAGNDSLAKAIERSLDVHAHPLEQVRTFHRLYGMPIHLGPVDSKFSHMSRARLEMRLGLIYEELIELLDACGAEIEEAYAGDAATRHVTVREDTRNRDIIEAADALGDILYVVYGLALEMGVDLRAVFHEIHASNMTKLGENGRPIRREDGKILKGPDYVKPNIRLQLANLRKDS